MMETLFVAALIRSETEPIQTTTVTPRGAELIRSATPPVGKRA